MEAALRRLRERRRMLMEFCLCPSRGSWCCGNGDDGIDVLGETLEPLMLWLLLLVVEDGPMCDMLFKASHVSF